MKNTHHLVSLLLLAILLPGCSGKDDVAVCPVPAQINTAYYVQPPVHSLTQKYTVDTSPLLPQIADFIDTRSTASPIAKNGITYNIVQDGASQRIKWNSASVPLKICFEKPDGTPVQCFDVMPGKQGGEFATFGSVSLAETSPVFRLIY